MLLETSRGDPARASAVEEEEGEMAIFGLLARGRSWAGTPRLVRGTRARATKQMMTAVGVVVIVIANVYEHPEAKEAKDARAHAPWNETSDARIVHQPPERPWAMETVGESRVEVDRHHHDGGHRAGCAIGLVRAG